MVNNSVVCLAPKFYKMSVIQVALINVKIKIADCEKTENQSLLILIIDDCHLYQCLIC